MEFKKVYEFIKKQSINYCINKGCNKSNYKINMRAYIKECFKADNSLSNEDIEQVIQEAYKLGEEIFSF